MVPTQVKKAGRTAAIKLAKHAIKHPRKTARRLRRAYRIGKFLKRLPRLQIAPSGKWNYRGEERARDDEVTQASTGVAGTWIFKPVTIPLERLAARLPPFREPKKWFKRKEGVNEKPLNLD